MLSRADRERLHRINGHGVAKAGPNSRRDGTLVGASQLAGATMGFEVPAAVGADKTVQHSIGFTPFTMELRKLVDGRAVRREHPQPARACTTEPDTLPRRSNEFGCG